MSFSVWIMFIQYSSKSFFIIKGPPYNRFERSFDFLYENQVDKEEQENSQDGWKDHTDIEGLEEKTGSRHAEAGT